MPSPRAGDPAAPSAEAHHNAARESYRRGDVERAAWHLQAATRLSDSITPWIGLATIAPGCPGMTAADVLRVRREMAIRLERWTSPGGPDTPEPFRGVDHDRLRIGYLSAHFDQPNYMKPVWALINQHDRAEFEIHLLADCDATSGFPGYDQRVGDTIAPTGRLDNHDLARLIERHEIDILVDLNGYGVATRLPLFLRRNAPVTVAWFNMYATSGLPGVDYIVGDAEVVRPDDEPHFSERVVRLPLSYLTFEVCYPVPTVTAPPCASSGHVTFGSLAPLYKITPAVLDAWCRILRNSGTARLLLANTALGATANCDFVIERFRRRGIPDDRVTLLPGAAHRDFLRYYEQIDLALDTFPYSGGTTTMEALWQGVPVLTFVGDRWAARITQSLLRHAALGEFVAPDLDAYVALATRIAADPRTPEMLTELRGHMRDQLAQSSVCDTAALARAMEYLYRKMWAER